MLESKYLKRFQTFKERAPVGKLYGGRMLLEVVSMPEAQTEGGLVIAESDHARAEFVMLKATLGIVLEVGQGYFDSETGEDVPLDIKVGDVVWVPSESIRSLTTVPGMREAVPSKTLALGQESEIIKKWNSLEDYLNDQEKLNVAP
jgi:co-chaperonin GroES (HSP10)